MRATPPLTATARAAACSSRAAQRPAAPSRLRRRRAEGKPRRVHCSSAGYGFGASVTASALLMLPMLIAMFVAGVLSGGLQPRLGAKHLLMAGSGMAALACALLAVFHDEQWHIAVAAGVFGLGVGPAFASMANLIVSSVPAEQAGAATGMNANLRSIGGAIMSLLVTSHLAHTGLPQFSSCRRAARPARGRRPAAACRPRRRSRSPPAPAG